MISTKIKYCISCVIIIILFFMYEGCSSNIIRSSKMNLTIKIKNEYAWLNLMPGSNAAFHIKGNLDITNTGQDTVRDLKLKEMKIYRDSSLIYTVNPDFRNTGSTGDFDLPPMVEKHFSFQLPNGIRINKEIGSGQPIDVLFIFKSDGSEFEYIVNKVKVDKVY